MSDVNKNREDQKKFTAAVIVIGNEILSGRTLDKNTQWIADRLTERGIALREARVIPDDEATIIKTVNELKAQQDYIFTTGGIGPTHDDITAACMAKAFEVELVENAEARRMLLDHYGEADLTETRLRMALIPEGASLIPNPVSAAPGFVLENVHVMAGVPKIMQAMLDNILPTLEGGEVLLSNTIACTVPESELAGDLAGLQAQFKDVEIGSYPHFKLGNLGVSVVLRSTDEAPLKEATIGLLNILEERGEEPQAMSFQVPLDA